MKVKKEYKRKIQLIAGSTYSVSIPKELIEKNNIVNGDEVFFKENNDLSLLLNFKKNEDDIQRDDFSFCIEDFREDVSQILFVLYYLGFKSIKINSKDKIGRKKKIEIKDTVEHLAGAEVVNEEENVLEIRVFIDNSLADINQIFQRIFLLIISSIESLKDGLVLRELERNEREVNRFYHLALRLIVLSQKDFQILKSSGIGNFHFLQSYQYIVKKLENLADRVFNLKNVFDGNQIENKKILDFFVLVVDKLKEDMSYYLNRDLRNYLSYDKSFFEKLSNYDFETNDMRLEINLLDILRFLKDIESAMTNISVYSRLIDDKKI